MALLTKDIDFQTFYLELYKKHYRRIFNICLRIIGNSADAEETMHDVFLKIFDKIDDLQDETAFNSWSKSIAIRMSVDRIRKKKYIFEPIDNLSIEEEENEDKIELSVETIKDELNRLPAGYRIVLSMRLFEECEFEYIANILQIKESTVRSQYVRGRDKLAKMLKNKIKNQ